MFTGHYGPAAAAAGARIKLWHAVLAVQFLDLLWAPFILLGIERARIAPGITAASPLDLYHMPWTHSLAMAVFWSAIAAALYRAFWPKAGTAAAVLIGGLVFSHWIADFITHRPDLALWIGGPRVGLGLWNSLALTLLAELGLLAAGVVIFAVRMRPNPGRRGRAIAALAAFLVVAAGLQLYGAVAPPPQTIEIFAGMGLFAFALFAVLAAGVDATWRPRGLPGPQALSSSS